MSDEECDIDALSALLDDSDEDLADDSLRNNPPQATDKECDLDTLAAFLEESDDEPADDIDTNELVKTSERKSDTERDDDAPTKSPKQQTEAVNSQTDGHDKVNDIQAELLKMQQKMLELQEQLKRQQETVTSTPSTHTTKQSSGAGVDCENPFFPSKCANTRESVKDKMAMSQNKVKCTTKQNGGCANGTGGKTNSMTNNDESMKKELFGDSDSDWDELDGEEKVKLNESGAELKTLLRKGEKDRMSNVTKDEVALLRNKATKSSWKDKPFEGQTMVRQSPQNKQAKENDAPSITDPFSGIRIINPKVSTIDMKYKMENRKLIKVSKIQSKRNSTDLQGNWVTIGVVVHKSEARTSANGKTYCIWKVSDLDDCDKTISIFLFGEVYKQHWKNEVRTVVGLLNPHLMDKAEKAQQDLAFTVNHPNQILVMGHSKDLGKCRGVSRAGKPCTNFINREQGDFCVYHVQSAYRSTSSKRTELQGGAAVTPKNHMMKQKKNKDSFFFYQGETFTNMRGSSSNSSKKDGVTLKKLQEQQARFGKGKITTMSLHQLDPDDVEKLKSLNDKQSEFVSMLTTPTVGSMNFVKHLVKKENQQTESSDDKKVIVQSISATDLLRQHKQAMIERKKQQAAQKTKANPMTLMPSLGKGCIPGGVISLDPPRKGSSQAISSDAAKRLAISRIKEKGGIEKQDPNAVRKKSSPEAKDKIKKRALENSCDDGDQKNEEEMSDEPPRKRSKLLGNLDENSEDFKKLMKSKSKHTGALAEAEQEMQDQYFMALEKKEKYEEKMESTLEVKCIVFTCRQCQYTAFKVADKCKAENHVIKRVEAKKRFFKCKKCGRRKICIQKFPTDPCKECGEYNYERTAMHEARKGSKLPHEALSIRGDEIKHLGSLNEKVYLNL